MDIPKRLHNAGLDDEKAFTETLVTDHGHDAGGPVHILKAKEGAAPPAESKFGTKQPAWAGKIMGHFKLLRLIGEGAMGLVIQAEDTNLRRIVALKVLRKQLTAGEKGKEAVEQFIREARAAAAIEHPNIVRVYEINQHAGWWYIAMEMVEGNSLQEIVKAAGAMPVSRACPIIADAAIALQVAHELGMIHRDIKPSNILVTRNGHGKVSDFGLVRVDDPKDPFDIYAHQSIGTPYYMSPEVIRREPISPAVDIYSLGATLYYILTARPPYAAEKMEDVLRQHLHEAPPDLRRDLPDSSPNLVSLIQRMMAKEPTYRPVASEVAAILHAEAISFVPDTAGLTGMGGSTIVTDWQGIQTKTRMIPPSLIPSKARNSLLGRTLLISAILLVGGILAFWLYTNQSRPRQDRRAVRRLFPQSPENYGIRNPGTIPTSLPISDDVPAFSWKGKVDSSNWSFVASRTGRYFYAVDDQRALLIMTNQCVGYSTAEQALKDGKQPAP